MSYILDALRKAERDRNLGRTPSLGDVTATSAQAPSRRPTPRTLALMALVVVLLIATLLFWPRRPATETPAPAPSAAAGSIPAIPPAVEPPAATPLAPPSPVPPPEIAEAPSADRTLAPDVPAESIDDLLEETEMSPEGAGETEVQPSAAAPTTSAEAPDAPEAAPVPPVTEEASEPAPVDEGAVASDVPLLRDMPSDYRGAFPSLRVDVHVYDEDPERRWVMVNGRKAAEGTTLGEGPTVSRITPEGIVFDFRGSSVLIPLNR